MDAEMVAYFDRFSQQLSQQLADLRQELHREIAEFRQETNQRFEQVDQRFEQVDQRFEQSDARVTSIRDELVHQIAGVRDELKQDVHKLGEESRETRVLVERLGDTIQLVAEGVAGANQRIDRLRTELRESREDVQALDVRVSAIEGAAS